MPGLVGSLTALFWLFGSFVPVWNGCPEDLSRSTLFEIGTDV
jgi:hypothetical protein